MRSIEKMKDMFEDTIIIEKRGNNSNRGVVGVDSVGARAPMDF